MVQIHISIFAAFVATVASVAAAGISGNDSVRYPLRHTPTVDLVARGQIPLDFALAAVPTYDVLPVAKLSVHDLAPEEKTGIEKIIKKMIFDFVEHIVNLCDSLNIDYNKLFEEAILEASSISLRKRGIMGFAGHCLLLLVGFTFRAASKVTGILGMPFILTVSGAIGKMISPK